MSRKGFPSDKQDQYMVRFPDGMRDRIKSAAETSGRSMNAEIVARLDQALNAWPVVTMHPAIYERAAKYPAGIRGSFEVAVSAEAERMASQYFPAESTAFEELFHAFHYFLADVPDEKRAPIASALNDIIRQSIEAMPKHRREEMLRGYEQLFNDAGS